MWIDVIGTFWWANKMNKIFAIMTRSSIQEDTYFLMYLHKCKFKFWNKSTRKGCLTFWGPKMDTGPRIIFFHFPHCTSKKSELTVLRFSSVSGQLKNQRSEQIDRVENYLWKEKTDGFTLLDQYWCKDLFSGWSVLNAQISNTTSIQVTELGMFWLYFLRHLIRLLQPITFINIWAYNGRW